jgi:hypothetical protein
MIFVKLRVSFYNDKDSAFYNNKYGAFEIYFIGLGHWDEFDVILRFLKHEDGCYSLGSKEAIYIRKAELVWQNINFELMQDDMFGNYIFTRNIDDLEDLYQLALRVMNNIRLRLKELEDE